MADNTARITEINTILATGAQSVTTDGTTVNYDLASLRKERNELIAADDTQGSRKPRLASFNLTNQ